MIEKKRFDRKKYRQEHKASRAAYNRQWKKEHPDMVRASEKKYRELHREQILLRQKKYSKEHKRERSERERAGAKRYYWLHREERRAAERLWRARNPDRNYAARILRQHRMSFGEYTAMLNTQDGVCKICGDLPPKGKRLQLDHVHGTSTIRGLLCHRCNMAIGLLRDNVQVVLSAAQYLRESNIKIVGDAK